MSLIKNIYVCKKYCINFVIKESKKVKNPYYWRIYMSFPIQLHVKNVSAFMYRMSHCILLWKMSRDLNLVPLGLTWTSCFFSRVKILTINDHNYVHKDKSALNWSYSFLLGLWTTTISMIWNTITAEVACQFVQNILYLLYFTGSVHSMVQMKMCGTSW